MTLRKQDFTFELPPELIAQTPAATRQASRLLVGTDASPRHVGFAELGEHLPPRSAIIVNDTSVIPARLHAQRKTGGHTEVFVTRLLPGNAARALIRGSKRMRAGERLLIAGAEALELVQLTQSEEWEVAALEGSVLALLMRAGELPLPPYIARPHSPRADDRERYQTIFAAEPGAVAAPTAGLHFTPELVAELEAAGHKVGRLTLHVGLGTFAPIRVDELDQHSMHSEWYCIPGATRALLAEGRPIVAIGTTVVRALESAARHPDWLRSTGDFTADTDIFIRPPFRFALVEYLVTNFHLPESTLLVLVSTFAGRERVLAHYRAAVNERYRFFSYGDAMLLRRQEAE